MLLIYLEEGKLSEAQYTQCYQQSAAFARKLQESGEFVATSPLHPTATATTVRVQEGKRLVTDGPFAETREQLGGFLIIDVENLDRAIEIAGQFPAGQWGSVEIRPMVSVSGLIRD